MCKAVASYLAGQLPCLHGCRRRLFRAVFEREGCQSGPALAALARGRLGAGRSAFTYMRLADAFGQSPE
eukprot:11853138-Heterocapsa_arctica.AAC.1